MNYSLQIFNIANGAPKAKLQDGTDSSDNTRTKEHKSSCTNADNRRNKKTQKDITTEQGC